MYGLITSDDIGRNGLTKRDIGKYWIVCPVSRVVYVRKSQQEAIELHKALASGQ